MPSEPHLVYDFGVESLFRGLGQRVTPALKNKVRAVDEVNEAVPSAEFLCGVIEAIAGHAGAKTCRVTFADEPPLVVFSVGWS